MPKRDPIDDVIAEAERTRGQLPPEPDPSFQPASWASAGSNSPPRRRSKSTPIITAALVLIVLVIVAGVPIGLLFGRHEKGPRDYQSAAEKLVARQLKSPATAKFAPFQEWQFETIDDCTMRMDAWVDSQNSFSALLRSHFVAIIRFADGQWELVYLKLLESGEKFGRYLETPVEREASKAAAKAAVDAQSRKFKADEAAAAAYRKQLTEASAKAKADEAAAWQKMREQLDDVRARSK